MQTSYLPPPPDDADEVVIAQLLPSIQDALGVTEVPNPGSSQEDSHSAAAPMKRPARGRMLPDTFVTDLAMGEDIIAEEDGQDGEEEEKAPAQDGGNAAEAEKKEETQKVDEDEGTTDAEMVDATDGDKKERETLKDQGEDEEEEKEEEEDEDEKADEGQEHPQATAKGEEPPTQEDPGTSHIAAAHGDASIGGANAEAGSRDPHHADAEAGGQGQGAVQAGPMSSEAKAKVIAKGKAKPAAQTNEQDQTKRRGRGGRGGKGAGRGTAKHVGEPDQDEEKAMPATEKPKKRGRRVGEAKQDEEKEKPMPATEKPKDKDKAKGTQQKVPASTDTASSSRSGGSPKALAPGEGPLAKYIRPVTRLVTPASRPGP